jgi:thioredoxin-related protein
MMYISLAEAKVECRIDHDLEDSDIIGKIQSASSMVKAYIKDTSPYEPLRDAEDNPRFDSNDEPLTDEDLNEIRYEVRAATTILVRKLVDRTLESRPGYLPDEVQAILYPLRTPTLA